MKKKLDCILLIDDDEATNFFSNIILEEAGRVTHIETTQTAKSALDYLEASGRTNNPEKRLPFPDLIFLDINMPAMDGWEFIEQYITIKNKLPRTPVIIMLSTSINPDDKIKALNIPEVADFYNKPINADIIDTIIQNYFPTS